MMCFWAVVQASDMTLAHAMEQGDRMAVSGVRNLTMGRAAVLLLPAAGWGRWGAMGSWGKGRCWSPGSAGAVTWEWGCCSCGSWQYRSYSQASLAGKETQPHPCIKDYWKNFPPARTFVQKMWCSGKTTGSWAGEQCVGLKGNSRHMGDPCLRSAVHSHPQDLFI